MRYLELEPSPPLRPFVACLWILEGAGNPAAGPRPIFPDGRAELIVHYGDRFRRSDDGNHEQARGFLVGQIDRAIRLQEGTRVGVVAARLAPAGVAAMARESAAGITGRVVEITAVAGADGRRLVERVHEARSDRERLAALERFLLSWLTPAAAPDPRVGACVRLLHATGGRARIDRVAGSVGLSTRQLHRRVQECVGLAPKPFAQIVRFQRAMAALGAGQPLTDTAVACGYHDHAHFTREFRRLGGMPPSAFLRHPSPLAEHFLEKPSDSYKTRSTLRS
jgi:AraC-like DNA-binding protein